MPLSPTELRDEALVQLRRLVQSPGWDLYRTQVSKRVARSESEKAKLLREEKYQAAALEQGRVDGLREALDTIHQYMEGLEVPEPGEPAY